MYAALYVALGFFLHIVRRFWLPAPVGTCKESSQTTTTVLAESVGTINASAGAALRADAKGNGKEVHEQSDNSDWLPGTSPGGLICSACIITLKAFPILLLFEECAAHCYFGHTNAAFNIRAFVDCTNVARKHFCSH